MSNQFSFIVLTFNEEIHLPRLLKSIENLKASIYILDSGSTDGTLEIAKLYNAEILYNKFENHPKQWNFALNNFKIDSPWIIGLDADHIVSPELLKRLETFNSDKIPKNINGIYFNRKNYFKGSWIRFGGYFPKYMLKMFRKGFGDSDLQENMDHRFIVEGETQVWKDGYLVEENLKENKISFWINKHNRYSDLIAEEEIERRNSVRVQSVKAKLLGNPDERIAFLKKVWWKMPLFIRPFIYFFYRYFLQLGFLDGKNGFIFHFLQAFWFRLLVDIKIDELNKNKN